MKKKNRRREPHHPELHQPGASMRLDARLEELVINAAMLGQGLWGRGMLRVQCADGNAGGITWEYKPMADCSEELDEWADLRVLMTGYDPRIEVLIALVHGSVDFFRLSTAARST